MQQHFKKKINCKYENFKPSGKPPGGRKFNTECGGGRGPPT
jgi:hypothetical protein